MSVGIHLGPDVTTCQVCGKPLGLFNLDKMRGVVGLTHGWLHITRSGRVKRRSDHRPVVVE